MVQEESSQCTEGMSYVGFLNGVASGARLVLGGDHRQLAPVINSEYARKAGYGISLHRRIANNIGDDPALFHTPLEHYRSHPGIMFVYSHLCYSGKLICRVDPKDRPCLRGFPAEPVRKRPADTPDSPDDPKYGGLNSDAATGGGKGDVHRVTLIHVDGEEVSTGDGGKANLKEAAVVCDLVARISEQCVAQRFSVLVTTPYATQRALFEYGAPCHPDNLKRKELRTKVISKKKAKKEVRTRSDGSTYTASEGTAHPTNQGQDEDDAGPKRRHTDSHALMFGAVTHEQGSTTRSPPLRERAPKELNLTIASIDQAQGLEADVVVTCTTRANHSGDMGFVNEPERWNVNISRARCHLIIVGNVTCFDCAKDAELPPMLLYLLRANCVKTVRFRPDVPGIDGIALTNVTRREVANLPRPLTDLQAFGEVRNQIVARAAEHARKRRRLDRDKAWEDRQGLVPPVGRAAFLERLAKLFHYLVTHPVWPSLENHLTSCARHHNYVGYLPQDKLDCDLKEISMEGYCQTGMFLDPGNNALSVFEYAAHRAVGMDTPTGGAEAAGIPNWWFLATTTPVVGRLCPTGSQRFRPFMVNQPAMECTRHHALPLPDKIPTMNAAAAKAAESPRGLDRMDTRLRSLLCAMRWWRRDYNTVPVPMVDASDVGDRVEARMGLLRSFRAAMNEIFATICARDGVDHKAAADLRVAMDACLTHCVDLLAWAPFYTEPCLDNPAGVWKELQRQRQPLRYVIPLIDEAIPVIRDSVLTDIRNGDECSICVLYRELLGSEVGLSEQGEFNATQHGGALCRGGAYMDEAPPEALRHGMERRPDYLDPWDTRLQQEPSDIRCNGATKPKTVCFGTEGCGTLHRPFGRVCGERVRLTAHGIVACVC